MSELKLSQLTEASNVASTDLIEIAQDQGAGSYSSKKITWSNAASSITSFAKLDGTNQPFTGNLNVSNASPEIRMTDTTNSEYTRITRSDTLNLAQRTNRVLTHAPAPTGGTIVYLDSNKANPRSSPAYDGGYTVHKFLSGTNNFVTDGQLTNVTYLMVAGGGTGGCRIGAGGGAGGILYSNSATLSAGTYPVVVGAGGTASGTTTNNGNNTTFNSLTAIGGGKGADNINGVNGSSGGSGGGTAQWNGIAGSGTSGQGNRGGDAAGWNGITNACGGGGGKASVGTMQTSSTIKGNGGAGQYYADFLNIGGSPAGYFGGGGGGGTGNTSGAGGTGGTGGGANGGAQGSSGNPGTANTGGGGGGASNNSTGVGGNGGSGVVYIMYATPAITTNEVTIWSSKDGEGASEQGIQTFGHTTGRTIVEGTTTRFNVVGSEKAQLNSSNFSQTIPHVITGSSDAVQFKVTGNATQTSDIMQIVQSDGTSEVFSIGLTDTVFNETGADRDFRIESDTDANMFYVDSGNNRIGIGTATPSAYLNIVKAGNAKANVDFIQIDNTTQAADMDGTATGILFKNYTNAAAAVSSGRISVGTETDWTSTAATQDSFMGLSTTLDGTLAEKVRITSAGNVGIGTNAPLRKLDVNEASGNCLRLIYNDADGSAANYTDFLVSSSGDLTITPSGGDVELTSANFHTSGEIKGVHKAADGTAAVADGTYTVGIGTSTNGTITIKDGIITAIQQAT